MRKRNLSLMSTVLAAALSASMLICAIPVSAADTSTVVLNGKEMSLDDLIKNAKEEGDLQSVGMPDDWANWKGSWDAITDTYGITHGDVDMTSAEELSQFAAEKDDPTKDIGDIGLSMTPEAIKQDVIGTYKASTWDSFPDWAKDPDGRILGRCKERGLSGICRKCSWRCRITGCCIILRDRQWRFHG